MKNFDYAKKNNKKWFKIPCIKTKNYEFNIFALPIVPFVIAFSKFKEWEYDKLVWDEKKAKKALDYFLPYVLEYIKSEKTYYYCMEWHYDGFSISKRAPFYLKSWVKKFGYQIFVYLKDDYEKIGYTKIIEKKNYYETWIKFSSTKERG